MKDFLFCRIYKWIPVIFFLSFSIKSSGQKLFEEKHSLAKTSSRIVYFSWIKLNSPLPENSGEMEELAKHSKSESRFFKDIRRQEENAGIGWAERVRKMVFNHVSFWDCGEYISTHRYMPDFYPPGNPKLVHFLNFLKEVNYSAWPVNEYDFLFENSPEDSSSLIQYLNRENYGSPDTIYMFKRFSLRNDTTL